MKKLISVVAALAFLHEPANAQFSVGVNSGMYGAGVWGGAQACPYPYMVGDGAVDDLDHLDELKKDRSKLRSDLSKARRKLTAADRNVEKAIDGIRGALKSGAAETVKEHIQGNKNYSDYGDACSGMRGGARRYDGWKGPSSARCGEIAGRQTREQERDRDRDDDRDSTRFNGRQSKARGDFCARVSKYSDPDDNCAEKDTVDLWKLYAQDSGSVDATICTDNFLLKPGTTSGQKAKCESSIANLRKYTDDKNKVQEEIENLEKKIEAKTQEIADETDRIKEERKQRREDGDYADRNTEGGYCPNGLCPRPRQPSTLQSILGFALVAGMGAGTYFNTRSAINHAARLGWPVQPAMVTNAMLPWAQMGLYGALGAGIGRGGFGCAGMMSPYGMMGPGGLGGMGMYPGAGGAFGYPMGMGMNPMMGMMNPYMMGMGPWGMNGMGALGGMPMNPMMMGMMGNPMMGGMNPMMMGMMGNPMMGGMNPMMMGMGNPMMGGMNPMMMGMMGNPMMGGMNPMMMGMGNPMMGGMMNPMMGMMGGAPFMPGYGPYGPMAGMNPMMGGMMNPMMGNYGLGGYQMQQQMMMMYAQQAQAQIQMQQQQTANYYQRMQTIGQLQLQIQQITMQINMISSGLYFGGGGQPPVYGPGVPGPGVPGPGVGPGGLPGGPGGIPYMGR